MNRLPLVFALCGMLFLRAETGRSLPKGGGGEDSDPESVRAEGESAAGREARNGMVWMDQSQEWVTEALFRRLVWFDSMFYQNPSVRREDPRSRFRMKLFGVMDLEALSRPTPDMELFASVALPGLRQRFQIVLDSEELDAFPGQGPDEQADRFRLALRRAGRWLDADIGAKLGSRPRAFSRLTARQNWETAEVSWSASQRGFYDTDEGFGTVANLAQHLWPLRYFILGHSTSLRWSESTTGVEWQDSYLLAYVPKLIEAERHGQFISPNDMANSLGVRASVRGQHDGSHAMDSYRAALVYRRPLFNRDYLYLEVVPEVVWSREENWEPVYSLKTGLDVLFWRDL